MIKIYFDYKWTSLFAIYRDQKIRLAHNDLAYKKTKNDSKLGIRSRKMINLKLQIHKFADKKTPCNEVVHLYFSSTFYQGKLGKIQLILSYHISS
jgi:hypothetical protein